MPLEFKVEGLDDLRRAFRRMRDLGVDHEVKRIAEQAAVMLWRDMVRRAPYDPQRKKGTHLRDAIFVGLGPEHKSDVLVGVNMRKAPHAWLVEFGSRMWSGKPYFRPAIELLGASVTAMINRAMERLIERKWEEK